LCADPRAHLQEEHPGGVATLRDMLPVLECGKVDPRSCSQLREIGRNAIAEMLGRLPAEDAERLRTLLGLVDRFLPEECGGTPVADAN